MKSNIIESLNSDEKFKFKTFSNFDYVDNRLNKKSIFEFIYIFVKQSII